MQPTKPPEIKALVILHRALLTGQALFLLIAAVINITDNAPSTSSLKSYPTQMFLLCTGVGIVSYLAGNFLFNKKLEQINTSVKPLSERFGDYRSACLTRWALLEFATLFCIILFLVSRINELLIVAAALILLFITIRPSLGKAASSLNVSETEIEQMSAGSSI